jgi:apoptosis-inducing factor 2
MSTVKQRIIVVGGGGAGSIAARSLSEKIDVSKQSLTLVTSRPYNVFLPAQCRATVSDQGHLEKETWFSCVCFLYIMLRYIIDEFRLSYSKLLHEGKGTIKIGTVEAIEPNKGAAGGHVVLKGGERMLYDVLVLAPGSKWEGPLSHPDDPEDALSNLVMWRKHFANSSHIVLAGGGAVAIGSSIHDIA